MATMIRNETHRYECDEVSGAMLDKVGSRDSDFSNGTPVYNGNTISTDGVSAALGFTGGVGVSPWIWSDVNGSAGYIKFVNQEAPGSQDGTLIVITGADVFSQAGPYMFWDDVNAVNGIRCSINISQGTYYKDFLLGREMKIGEGFVWAWSWDHTTRDWIYVLKSDDSTDPIDLTGTGTGITTRPTDDKIWNIGASSNLGNFGKFDFDQFGCVIGSQFTLAELQSDAGFLLGISCPLISDPTSRYINLNDGTFIYSGDTSIIDDQFLKNAGRRFGGVNGWGDAVGEKPFTTGTGVKHTLAFTLTYLAGDSPDNATFMAQRISGGNNTFTVALKGTKLEVRFDDSDGGGLESNILSGEKNWDNGEPHSFVILSDTNELDMFIDPTLDDDGEVTYNDHNILTGSGANDGFTIGFPTSPPDLSIGARGDGSNPAKCDLGGEIKFWKGTRFHRCQVKNFGSQERAKMVGGEPFFDPMITTMFNRLIPRDLLKTQ